MYEDTRVMDALEGDPIDQPRLKRLLVAIERTWMKDVGPLEEMESQHRMSFYSMLPQFPNRSS